jgi:hypothetical protein
MAVAFFCAALLPNALVLKVTYLIFGGSLLASARAETKVLTHKQHLCG